MPRRSRPTSYLQTLPLLLALTFTACGGGADSPGAEPSTAPTAPAPLALVQGTDQSPPAAAGALGPSWMVGGDRPGLSWLERLEAGGHALRFARLETDGSWGPVATIAQGDDFFANWADFPTVAEAPDGTLWAHWLAKVGDDTYAYGIFLARSQDGGATWEPHGLLHDDPSATEHGFVSYTLDGDGLRAFWLDGRRMADDGPMTLRTALLGPDGPGAEIELDDRVCECCQTAAATGAAGPLVLYRGRDEAEVRDIRRVRMEGDAGSGSAAVGNDRWVIPGCPVNGPAVAARDQRVAAAWYTGAAPTPRIQLAWSADAGATFGPAVEVSAGDVLGRVDILLDDSPADAGGAALISWLEKVDSAGEIRLARFGADGPLSSPVVAARTGAGRASGFPRLHREGDAVLLAWIETGATRADDRLRVTAIDRADLQEPNSGHPDSDHDGSGSNGPV